MSVGYGNMEVVTKRDDLVKGARGGWQSGPGCGWGKEDVSCLVSIV